MLGTYPSGGRPDGSLYGEEQGVMITADGEPILWKGSGVGKILAGGAVNYAAYCTTGRLRKKKNWEWK